MSEKDFVSTIEQTVPTSFGNELPVALPPVEASTETDDWNPLFSQIPAATTEEKGSVTTTPVPQYSQPSIAIGAGYIPVQFDPQAEPWLEIVTREAQGLPSESD